MTHICHARNCSIPVKPELLMCFSHWRRVPKKIQQAVWANYRAGQCYDKNVSEKWLIAADAAIGMVAHKENLSLTKSEIEALKEFGYDF